MANAFNVRYKSVNPVQVGQIHVQSGTSNQKFDSVYVFDKLLQESYRL